MPVMHLHCTKAFVCPAIYGFKGLADMYWTVLGYMLSTKEVAKAGCIWVMLDGALQKLLKNVEKKQFLLALLLLEFKTFQMKLKWSIFVSFFWNPYATLLTLWYIVGKNSITNSVHFILHVLSFLIWRSLIYWAGTQLVIKHFSWNHFRYIMVPSGNMGVFDPTEIHNRGQLKSHMKEAMIKLGFHLLCFFMYLYR